LSKNQSYLSCPQGVTCASLLDPLFERLRVAKSSTSLFPFLTGLSRTIRKPCCCGELAAEAVVGSVYSDSSFALCFRWAWYHQSLGELSCRFRSWIENSGLLPRLMLL